MNASGTASAAAPRRRPRDWVVDTLLFLLAVLAWLLTTANRLEASTEVEPAWLFDLDQVAGALGCLGLWLRRRWPVGLALALVALSTFSETVAGAMVVALFTVAIHRPPRTTARVYALSVLAALVYVVVRPEPGVPAIALFLFGVVVQGAAVGWGLFIHYRRQLVLSLRDRAVRAETEAHLRAEQAQQRARDEIAREMHDVLGHRLSLLSVHAGALEFRPDASPEEIARAAKVIRENAHLALQDLREVIGILRAPTEASRAEVEAVQERPAPPGWASAPVGELPQPTLGRRPPARRRVRPGRDAGGPARGARRRHRPRPGGPHRLPDRAGGPDQRPQARPWRRGGGPPGRVARRGPHRRGLQRGPRVQARAGPRPRARGRCRGRERPRPGQGLVGLAERVALADGRLEHGPTAGGLGLSPPDPGRWACSSSTTTRWSAPAW
jgi:hypothetical protein